jgi:tetratricopeptide (TPR) repeat protein
MQKKIKSILKKAEVYRTQGLLEDAKEEYKTVAKLIQNSENIQNKDKLLNAVSKKIAALSRHSEVVASAPTTPEMSEHVNVLIKKLFSFSKDNENVSKEEADLEGAIALAKFGQFDAALEEFERLLSSASARVPAAKNILRCHVTVDSSDLASAQLDRWESEDLFSTEQNETLRTFLEGLLEKKKIKKGPKPAEVISPEKEEAVVEEQPPEPETMPEEVEETEDLSDIENEKDDSDEEFLDISAVAITFDSGPHAGEQVELDVSFQSGNIISLIISSKDESLVENLQVGYKLDDVHFYSPIAIFRGSGIVSAMTKIASGPKQGDYSLDIKIESI